MTDDHERRQGITPPLEEVAAAYQDILTHNAQHTGHAAAIHNLMASFVDAGAAIESNDEFSDAEAKAAASRVLARTVTEADMTGELRNLVHEDIFMRIGIKIGPFGAGIDGGKEWERAASTVLQPMIENTELFAGFLSQLGPKELQADERNFQLMLDALNTLKVTVDSCFGEMPGRSEEEKARLVHHGEEVLRTFVALDGEYKRLGIGPTGPESYRQYLAEGKEASDFSGDRKRYSAAILYAYNYRALENYVTYWGRDVLPEYLAVGSMEQLAGSKERKLF